MGIEKAVTSKMFQFPRTIPPLLLALVTIASAEEPPRLPADRAAALCQVEETAVPVPGTPTVTTFAPLMEKVTPSVVSIFPATISSSSDASGPLDRFFGRGNEEEGGQQKADAPLERIRGVGSGVIVSADGWIVTNSHVVHLVTGKIADTFFVELHDHRRFHAKIAGTDPLTDLALLKIEATDLAPLKFSNSENVKAGDLVFAVGNPFQVGITCTMGMVSATRRSNIHVGGENTFENYIQTDAAINPGNSGGALVDASGRLVGINTAILGGQGGNIGIGFAIPSNLVRHIAAKLAADGKVTRGFFGLSTSDVTDGSAAKVKLPTVAGAVVEAVMDGSAAATAGIQQGDVIVRAAGRPVVSRGDLRFELSLLQPGETISLIYWREGAEHEAKLIAGTESEKSDAGKSGARALLDILPGVVFAPAGGKVSISEVTSKEAVRAGLAPGMVIVSVNGTEITDIPSLESAFRSGINKVKALLNNVPHTLAIRTE